MQSARQITEVDATFDGGGEYGARTTAALPPIIRTGQIQFKTIACSSAGYTTAVCYNVAKYRAKQAGDASPNAVADQFEKVSSKFWRNVCEQGENLNARRWFTQYFPQWEQGMAYSVWLSETNLEQIAPVRHRLLDTMRSTMPDLDAAMDDADAARVVCNVADLYTLQEIRMSTRDEAGQRTHWRPQQMIDTTSLPFFFRAGQGRYVDGGLLNNGPEDALDAYDNGTRKRLRFYLGDPDLPVYAALYRMDPRLARLMAYAIQFNADKIVPSHPNTLYVPLQREGHTKLGLPNRAAHEAHHAHGEKVAAQLIDNGLVAAWLARPVARPRKKARQLAA